MDIINKFVEKLIGKHNLLVLVISISLSIYFIILLESLIEFWFGKFVPQIPESLHIIFSLILLLFFLKISLFLWEKFISLYLSITRFFKNNRINSIPIISEWIFQGSFKIIGDSLEVTASNSGCLIKNHQYKNFIMSFNIEIKNGGHAGIIFRAQDLDNYLMIQLVLGDYIDGSGTIITDIVPHIRFLGNWETFNITPAYPKPEPYHPTKINYYPGIPIVLEVKDEIATLTIKSDNDIEEFRWNIPTHTDPNIRQHLPYRTEKGDALTKPDPLDGEFVPKIWFRDKYGRVGFRAHSWEKVIISNLKIEEI